MLCSLVRDRRGKPPIHLSRGMWHRDVMQRSGRVAITVIRTVLGTALLILGIVGLFMPVLPGWLFIIPGLALLARDFAWAEKLEASLRARFDLARRRFEASREEPEAEQDAA